VEDAPGRMPSRRRPAASARQLGRLKPDILAVEAASLIPVGTEPQVPWLEWVISSWEPSYREVIAGWHELRRH
jgi:hypothetical protein